MDLHRIYSIVDQLTYELKLDIPMVNKTVLENFVDTELCMSGAKQIVEHLKGMSDITDVDGNL